MKNLKQFLGVDLNLIDETRANAIQKAHKGELLSREQRTPKEVLKIHGIQFTWAVVKKDNPGFILAGRVENPSATLKVLAKSPKVFVTSLT